MIYVNYISRKIKRGINKRNTVARNTFYISKKRLWKGKSPPLSVCTLACESWGMAACLGGTVEFFSHKEHSSSID